MEKITLPEWVKPGASFKFNYPQPGHHMNNRVFHIRAIVDGQTVLREWKKYNQCWHYTVENEYFFEIFAPRIVAKKAKTDRTAA